MLSPLGSADANQSVVLPPTLYHHDGSREASPQPLYNENWPAYTRWDTDESIVIFQSCYVASFRRTI